MVQEFMLKLLGIGKMITKQDYVNCIAELTTKNTKYPD